MHAKARKKKTRQVRTIKWRVDNNISDTHKEGNIILGQEETSK